ncbi:hypothetical protein H8D57_00530, partial [bacterium]|nr:hypothetical protein [bacterium]
MRLKLVISLIIGNLLFLADCDIVSASEENPVPNKTQMIAAPWLSVNSDEGYVVGFTAGLTNQNDMTSYLTGSQSTEGYTSLGFRGENNLKDSRLVYETHLTRVLRKAYPDTPNFPEYSEKAVVNRFQLDISVLEKPIFEIGIPGILEMGPDLMLDFSKGER